jgi:dipeptidyl aminopeptidase/acylaminoacyl peptidase
MKTNNRIRSCVMRIALGSMIYLAATAFALGQGANSSVKSFRQVTISPDGTHLAWVESLAGEGGGSAIYVQDLESSGSQPRRVSAASDGSTAHEEDVSWSPDSKQLAFLSDAAGDKQSELYLADRDGGAVRKLTSLKGFLADPAWSPDGKALAILFIENAPRAAGPLMPMTPETGVVDNRIFEQRLTVVDVASGTVRQLSPPDMYVYEFSWSPDSRNFAAIAAHGAGDSNWYVAQVYRLSLADGALQAVYEPHLQIAVPRWSPDGKSIAFIEGLMSDEGSTGGDIFVVPANGGSARNVTPGIAASPNSIYWSAPDKILFTENIDGQSGIATLNLNTGKIDQLWSGPESLVASFSADHSKSAAIRSSPAHPAEIWAGSIGNWKQLTHANDAIQPDWGEMKSLHWANDGMRVQGWLLYPKDYDRSRRYPMVVTVHGGPAAAVRPTWPSRVLNLYKLSTQGYFVLYPNPRGSYGQGEKFTQGNVKDFGYGDFRDIMAGVDEVVKTLPVDEQRIGIFGWSYGGYMTMWAVTQTHRFRAAVAGAGLSNWQSYYGENDIDEWMIPYFGASVYDDPAVYARSSPITFIKNAKTPTLILVGERDGEVPEPQSREFWHALKSLGVETQFVVYEGEGHSIRQPVHQRDIMERLVGWFDRYLKAEPAASNDRAAGK